MKLHVATTLFAYSLASVLVLPSLGCASGAKSKHVEEHESVDVEHRTSQDHKEVEHDSIPMISRDHDEHQHDEHQEAHQEVKKEHKEIHREVRDQKNDD